MIYKTKDIELDYSKISAPRTDYVPKLRLLIPNDCDENVKYTPDRPTVLILPGGGYAGTSEREAEPIAMHFLARGMNAAILYYSVKPAVFPVALLEALTAVKYLRETAEQYHADRDKIYVCGFSAGGHLAASVGTLWNGKEARGYFGENTQALKPDGLILAYPVIISDFDGEKMIHKGSFNNLLGEENRENGEMLEYLCLDRRVSKSTPPTFIWSTFEDTGVPCDSTLRFATALKKNGVPFELHIYEKGTHGKATGDLITNKETYRLKNWLKEVCDWIEDTRSAYLD